MSSYLQIVKPMLCLAALAGMAGIPLSCTSPDAQISATAQEPMEYHNWWNYYERGCDSYKKGDYAGAKADFETCLGLRPGAKFGYPEEQWRARTYGMHFVEGYFPHRELGVCCYQLGDVDKATQYLDLSLRKEPTSRAKYYLNMARAKQVRGADIPPPVIRPTLNSGTITSSRTVTVNGSVSGAGLVREISVQNKRESIELAQPEVSFGQSIRLKEGDNLIRITASDLAGRTSSADLKIIADWRPPEVALRKVERAGGRVNVTGLCFDDQGLASLSVGGRELNPAGNTSASFEISFDENKPLLIEARDIAGNSVRTVLTSEDIAALTAQIYYDVFADAAESAPLPAKPADRLKPSLEIATGGKTTTVFDEEFYLDGKASDGGGLASVTVNGENILPQEQGGVLQTHFARRLPLDVGTNVFEVVATDIAGNPNRKTVSVIRKTPEYLDDEYRLRICFTPAANSEDEAQTLLFKRQAEQELTREPVRFRLLERNDEVWDLISREHELSLSPLADPQAALRIGKMLPAEMVLMSAFINRGDGIELYAGVRETANGTTVWSGDVYSKPGDENISQAIGDLVMKIKQNFPLVEGTVTAVTGKDVAIDIGADEGVRTGSRFLVMPDAGSVLKIENAPAEIEIARVKPQNGTGRILPDQATKLVKAGDRIFAR